MIRHELSILVNTVADQRNPTRRQQLVDEPIEDLLFARVLHNEPDVPIQPELL
ncbi:hypothetical protein D3C72_1210130 [compost metagenome]